MALNPISSTPPRRTRQEEATESAPVCVLSFNSSDPSGASGLSADIATISSIGGHALPVACGAYARDTARIYEHFALDDDAVTEQARTVLEAIDVQVAFRDGSRRSLVVTDQFANQLQVMTPRAYQARVGF